MKKSYKSVPMILLTVFGLLYLFGAIIGNQEIAITFGIMMGLSFMLVIINYRF